MSSIFVLLDFRSICIKMNIRKVSYAWCCRNCTRKFWWDTGQLSSNIFVACFVLLCALGNCHLMDDKQVVIGWTACILKIINKYPKWCHHDRYYVIMSKTCVPVKPSYTFCVVTPCECYTLCVGTLFCYHSVMLVSYSEIY